MKTAVLSLLLAPAAAFVAPTTQSAQVAVQGAKDEMVALAESNPDLLGSSIGFWDPLGALDTSFWGIGNEATIGYLRHAEI
eukprot:CAMPEP_0197421418 /NCGR_PEP_ID=MMETSP1170-20131217/6928_1 /TAXON_ID=54406 /ORGANISM="Sarcinochrysis sp, Strain CCMP770" /LENGTH=80 /DNA_ID=CAMNT_0042948655 /DNA_START=55 /DNA_END=294 /DNA_ORIENTATION=+